MNTLQRNEERLRLLQCKYQRLADVPENDHTLDQVNEMLVLTEAIEKLEKIVEKQRKTATATEAKEAERAAQEMMNSFIETFDIWFTAESGRWWYFEHGEYHAAKPEAFREKFRGYLSASDNACKLFQQTMDVQERKINTACYAWDDQPGCLNLLGLEQFCQPVETNGYHPIFDLLFISLGGAKAENVEHLEKLILAKWQHPDNYLLPCTVFADGGGTGKSVLVSKFLVTLFGNKNVADNLSLEMAFGKFNRAIAGKVIVFVNEAPEDKQDDKGMLRVIHSPTLNIEAKGRDPIPSVNTGLFFISTNPKSGGYAIRLAYNDVDRRFSIMHGSKPLKWYVAAQYDLPHDNDDDAGWNKMVSELQYVLSDPVEVGRWLYCKQRQYGDIPVLKALHGADYAKQAADTIEMHTRVFEAIFTEPEFQYIRSDLLFKLYQANGGPYKNINFNRFAIAYLEQHPELNVTYETAWPWDHSQRKQARLYLKNRAGHIAIFDGKRIALEDNDHQYGREDFGRWSFHVDVI